MTTLYTEILTNKKFHIFGLPGKSEGCKDLFLLGLMFDTRLNVTPFMGHLGCLASRWSVPVHELSYFIESQTETESEEIHTGN